MRNPNDMSMTDLRAAAKAHDVYATGDMKHDLVRKLVPLFEAEVEAAAKARAEFEAAFERTCEQNEFVNRVNYDRLIVVLKSFVEMRTEGAIKSFVEAVQKYGVKYAIDHHSVNALKSEEQNKVAYQLIRYFERTDKTAQNRLDDMNKMMTVAQRDLIECNDYDVVQNQTRYKIAELCFKYLTAEMDLDQVTFYVQYIR